MPRLAVRTTRTWQRSSVSDQSDIAVAIIAGTASVIGSVGAIAASVFAASRSRKTLTETRKHAADITDVKAQVKNSHGTNLRDEGDQRHAEIMATLHDQTDELHEQSSKLNQIDHRLRANARAIKKERNNDRNEEL